MHQDHPTLSGLPSPGEPVFYPRVGHCVYRGIVEDRAAPGKKLVELEDLEEGSRILIPTERVPKLGLRPAGRSLEEIQEELSSEFEVLSEEEVDLDIEAFISDGSPRNLARGLKRLHLLRQTTGLSREDEQTRRKIRSWLAAEVALSKDCTRAEAQAFITRILQEAMNAHRRKEREEAKERRRQVKAQKAAEDAASKEVPDTEAGTSSAAVSAPFLATASDELEGEAEAVIEEVDPSAPESPKSAEPQEESPGAEPSVESTSSATDGSPDEASESAPVSKPVDDLPRDQSGQEETESHPFEHTADASTQETSADPEPRDRESSPPE